MARCDGRIPITVKVDQRTHDVFEEESNRLGVYRSELLRRLIDTYHEARENELHCPHCEGELHFSLER